jgi:Na+-driven multidrug efflux pump
MKRSPTASFMHFFFGFMVFIGLSISMTVLVGRYSVNQDVAQRAAASRAMMLNTDLQQ